MHPLNNQHDFLLQAVTDGMISFAERDKFLSWLCSFLSLQMRLSHISIALYDSTRDQFPIEYSTGTRRFPKNFLSLTEESPLVRWFQNQNYGPYFIRSPQHIITEQDFKMNGHNLTQEILGEMKRYHVSICAKIETRHNLAGYLLIGPREEAGSFTTQDLTFFQTLARNIAIEIEKEEYYDLSHFDPLTGLLNRHSLGKRFQECVLQTKQTKREFAIALLDIDNFKMINDRYGHLVGDQVLRVIGEILNSNIRQTDTAFRFGGEEFLLLLTESSRSGEPRDKNEFHFEIFQVLERLRNMIAVRAFRFEDNLVPVTVSVGLTFYGPEMLKHQDETLQESDQALYMSKHHGKNMISVFPYV